MAWRLPRAGPRYAPARRNVSESRTRQAPRAPPPHVRRAYTVACPGESRTNAIIASTASGGPSKTIAPCRRPRWTPTRPPRAARPRGASSRGRRRPAPARGRQLGCARRPCRYRRQMTALEGELDACGGADAPPSAAARLKEVLAESLRHGRAELAKPRSGLDHAVEVAIAVHDGACRRHARGRDAESRPTRGPEREWLLVAAVVGALVELSGARHARAPRGPAPERGRAPRRLSRPRLPRRRARRRTAHARLRRARPRDRPPARQRPRAAAGRDRRRRR